MIDLKTEYTQASVLTSNNLRNIAHEVSQTQLSQLSLPEVDAIVDKVAQVAPAGNVPGIILNGLARISGRRPPAQTVKRDINLLFRGVEIGLDKAVYGAMFAGPAAIIWGYQNLLKLAGKDAGTSFPEGIWQFYVEYAMREDSARHAIETQGFDSLLKRHHISLSPVDRVTAWVMAAIHCLHQYQDLLANEWRERVYVALLQEVTGQYGGLYREWEGQKPYGRSSPADPSHTYAEHRQHRFDQFLAEAMREVSPTQRSEWVKRIQAASVDLPAYQQQLSILACLQPGSYEETRVPISLKETKIAVINQGRYYLLPVCEPGTTDPTDVNTVRVWVASLIAQPTGVSAVQLSTLCKVRRANLPDLRRVLNQTLGQGLEQLRLSPILLNSDPRSRSQPLMELRRAERGVGDHPLTIFDTGETFVFDQSHIFFDATWGINVAEILTREALSWAVYLHSLPPAKTTEASLRPLRLPFEKAELRTIDLSPQITAETSAETDIIKLPPVQSLRRLFKQRNDLLNLTVGDLLLLYRAIHATTYHLSPDLLTQLEKLHQDRKTGTAAAAALTALTTTQPTPAILIPLAADRHHPTDRVYPMVFEVPLKELDLLGLHARCLQALGAYEGGLGERTAVYAEFDHSQRSYLSGLAGFAAVLNQAKAIAATGENSGAAGIKLMANLPPSLQNLLNKIPGRFDVLTDVLRGREIFVNAGMAGRGGSVTRFAPAKDDSDKKDLVWGIVTDSQGNLRVTLRDFRPFIEQLIAAGQRKLAQTLTQHYLESYAQGFNAYIHDLRRITTASRETRLKPQNE